MGRISGKCERLVKSIPSIQDEMNRRRRNKENEPINNNYKNAIATVLKAAKLHHRKRAAQERKLGSDLDTPYVNDPTIQYRVTPFVSPYDEINPAKRSSHRSRSISRGNSATRQRQRKPRCRKNS